MPGRDAWLIYAAAFLRSATVGLVGVVLAIFLGEAGLSLSAIGLVIGVGLAGVTTMIALVTVVGDRLGRRRTLIVCAALTASGYLGLAGSTRLSILVPLAFVGMLNGMGRDRGAAAALEQAVLPQTTDPGRRTWVLAWYNLIIDAAHALGGLAGVIPPLFVSKLALTGVAAHRITMVACAATVALSALPYSLLTPRIEVREPAPAWSAPHMDRGTRAAVGKLALLFGIDSFGGGFLSSPLIAYWFFRGYGVPEERLAVLFFAARALNAISHVAAAWLAQRIGLLNTMVMTHLPSSLLLIAAPAASSAPAAAALFLGREALVEMDVPTRQSYVLAIVPAEHRTLASGVTNLTRTAGWAVGPIVAGFIMQHVVLAAPLILGASLKVVYDLILYASFRHIRPPEEAKVAPRP